MTNINQISRITKDSSLCTDTQIQEFVNYLKSHRLHVHIDSDDEVTLEAPAPTGHDQEAKIEIANMCAPCVVRFEPAGLGSAYIECSLDFGNGMEPEDSLQAEIPLMKIRLYPMELHNGEIKRRVPHPQTFEAMIDEMTGAIDVDFYDPYAPSEGETIIKFSDLQYDVTQDDARINDFD